MEIKPLSWKKLKLTHGVFSLIDASNYRKIAKYKWYYDKSTGYAARTQHIHLRKNKYKSKKIYLHHLILGNLHKKNKITDHINGNRLDNRKSNLRLVTFSQSLQNTQDRKSLHGRGIKYCQCGCKKKWQARIKVNKQEIYLGSFETIGKAKTSRKKATKRLFREYAR